MLRMGLVPALREMGYVNDRIVFVRQNGGLRSAFGVASAPSLQSRHR